MGQQTRRSILWQFLDDHILNISKRAKTIFKAERIIVFIMSFDEPSFVRLKIFLRIHAIRILLNIMRLSLLAVVNAFLEVVFNHIHFSDDSLNSNQFICHLATQPSGCYKVGS